MKERHQLVLTVIQEVKDLVKSYEGQDLAYTSKSSAKDLVSKVDQEVEALIISRIKADFPQDKIVGEESSYQKDAKKSQGYAKGINQDWPRTAWFIDPIDGTLNFLKQRNNFTLIIAYYEAGEAKLAYIYDFKADSLYHALAGKGVFKDNLALEPIQPKKLANELISLPFKIKDNYESYLKLAEKSLGLRYYGSAGLESIKVFDQELAAYLNPASAPWDIAATILMAKELGLKMSNFQGETIKYPMYTDWILAEAHIHSEILELVKDFIVPSSGFAKDERDSEEPRK